MNETTITKVLLWVPILMFSVIAHEIAHGYAALRQGDNTALMLGRLSWNPIRHIDPFMTILMPLFLLWATSGQMALAGAKPVPVNPRNYREYKRGDIIVSLAGVVTNFFIAIGCAVLIVVFGLLGRIPALSETMAILQIEMILGILLNFMLIMFNLLPIPPLDGSHVMKYLLPPAWSLQYQRLGFFGLFIIIILMQTGFLSWWMTPASYVSDALLRIVGSFVIQSPFLQLIFS